MRATRPTRPAINPSRRDAFPSSGLTVRTSCRWSSTGSAPEFRTTARFLASASLKLPVISPVPPVIGPLTVGADATTPSRTMANCLLTSRVVASPKFLVPALFKVNTTRHPGWVVEDGLLLELTN